MLVSLLSWCVSRRSRAAAALLAATLCAPPTARSQELDAAARERLQRLIETRGFTRGLPSSPMPSPDAARVYFLRSGPTDRSQVLYVYDVRRHTTTPFLSAAQLGGSGAISREEQARRERQRQTERGITGFQLSRDGRVLLVPDAGDLYLVDAADARVRRLTATPTPEIDAHLSPDAGRVAFLRGRDLLVLDSATRREIVVAHSDDPNVAYGAAEFVAQEEMHRQTGHWWAPDSRRLAFTAVDTRGVPRFRVPDFEDPTGEGYAAPYPKPGDPNAQVRLGVADLDSAATPRWFDLGFDVEYLARVDWSPDGRTLWVQTQPRSQKRLDLRRIDLRGGPAQVVLREEDRDWVNLHDDLRLLAGGARFLWSSERSGHRHLEVRNADGSLQRRLTSGDWDVVQVLDVDEKRGEVTFTATKDGVLEQHLYRVRLDGGEVQRSTVEPGWHDATFHRYGHDLYVESFSEDRTPPRLRLRARNGEFVGELPSAAASPSAAELGPVAEYVHLVTAAGVPLDLRIVQPPRPTPGGRLPLVIDVYAGPGTQQVRRAWMGERGLFDTWLAARGFVVARIDGRGAQRRGRDSERIFARRLGDLELQDQVAGVRALLARLPEVDPARVGIWGWSYGGYMTLRALVRAPGVFAAGVAVAPVVDWHGYDSHYTERFLGLPAENAAGYDSSSVLPYVASLRGHLMLVHGATDDNVHCRESMLLVRALVQAGKRFDLMIFPGTHMMESLPERQRLYELVWRTFAANL